MARAIALLATLGFAASVPALQSEDPAALVQRLQRDGRTEEIPRALERYRLDNPQSPRLPEVILLELQHLRKDSPFNVTKAIGLLRTLHHDYPSSPEAVESAALVPPWTGWAWTAIPRYVHAGPTAPVHVEIGRAANEVWSAPPTPNFEIYRLPLDAHREALRRHYAGAVDDLPDRSTWQRITATPLFPAGNAVDWTFPGPGHYVVEERLDVFRHRSLVTASRFAMLVKYARGKLLVFTTDPATGGVWTGINVEAIGDDLGVRGKTGRDGLLVLGCPRPRGILAWSGDDLQDCLLDESEAETPPGAKVYVTTDRPIYRPGQTVYYKAVHRDLSTGAPALPGKKTVKVEVLDSGGRCLQKQDQEWSALGTLTGSFHIGDEPPLGEYRIRLDVPRPDNRYTSEPEPELWSQTFSVAAYRKPDVNVAVEFPDSGVVPGVRFTARIRATAYHGGPVADADVSWTAGPCYRYRRPAALEPPIFEEPLAWFIPKPDTEGFGRAYDEPFDGNAQGTGKTGPDGTLDVVIPMGSYSAEERWGVSATVRDLSRLESVGSATLDLRPGSLRLTVGATRRFHSAGEAFESRVRVSTADGKPAAGRTVEVSGMIRRTTGEDREKETEFESVCQGVAKTDDAGLAVFKMRSPEAGILRLKATVVDGSRRRLSERAEIRIAGDDPEPGDGPQVIADKRIYSEGETARILLRVPKPGVSALLTVESGELHEERPIRLERTNEIVEVPLRASHAPNVVVHLSAWKDNTWVGGGTELLVVPAQRILDVAVRADRPQYRPRERATITLATTLTGRGVPSEVELAVVDESIFALRPDTFPDLRTFFLPMRPEAVDTSATWDWYRQWDTPARGNRFGPLTGATFALSLDEPKLSQGMVTAAFAPTETRRWFPDTLKWLGAVKTDAEGRATVEVEMPDSLTSWRIVARAVSGAAAFGQGQSSTLTRKNIIVRLSAPRFYIAGDEGVVSAVVRNNFVDVQELRVRLLATGVEASAAPTVVQVEPGEERRVEWKLKLLKPGTVTLKAEAQGKLESDAMEIEVPVKDHGDDRVATTAGIVRGAWTGTLELPEHASPSSARLELRVTGPGSDAILEALPSLIGYPYGCVEQTMSRFLPAVTAGRALARLKIPAPALQAALPGLVEQGLQRLYGFQHEDGGWGWWKYDETHPRMTAYVVYGLALARDAGYAVDERTLKDGVARLRAMEPTPFGNYALKLAGGEDRDPAKGNGDEDLAWTVLSGHREALLRMNTRPSDGSAEADIRRVSMVLRALASVDRNDPRIPPLVSWLLSQRRGGAWISTYDTSCAVFALTDLLQGESQKVEARVRVNGKELRLEDGRATADASFLKAGSNRVEVESPSLVYASALLGFVLDEEMPSPTGEGLFLSRTFERRLPGGEEPRWEALESGSIVHPGDELRMTLTVRSAGGFEYVMIDAPIAAGTEARENELELWQAWYGRQEVRDDRVCVAATHVGEGISQYQCRLRPTQPGRYHLMPAKAWPMYDPDRRATSGEFILRVADR
jgi:hypothetical protein